jgi:hypothetical protein
MSGGLNAEHAEGAEKGKRETERDRERKREMSVSERV